VFGNARVFVWIWDGIEFWVCALSVAAEWSWFRAGVAELTACVGVRFWIAAAVGFFSGRFGFPTAAERVEFAATEWVGLGSIESAR
jgi:hypothetical protein